MGSHSRQKLDLTGQRFGKLLVLGPEENIGDRTAWRCRCDCGKEAVMRTALLRNGQSVSCGCDSGPVGLESLTYVDGTCLEMLRAKTVRRNNTSGFPGVDWRPERGKWRAAISFKGKRYSLGYYDRLEDAVKARRQGEEELHDKFLREYAGASASA